VSLFKFKAARGETASALTGDSARLTDKYVRPYSNNGG